MWIIFALLSSITWGLDYIFAEKLLQKISISTLYSLQLFFGAIVMMIFSLLTGSFTKDLPIIANSKPTLILLTLVIITSTLANLFAFSSIQAKNATLATLIEISYPIFIILFGLLIFKQNHLNLSVILGGILIFSGILVISYFNR